MKKAVIVFLFVKLCVSVFGQEYVLTDTASYDYFVKIPKGEVLTGISEIIDDCTIGENSIPYNLRSYLQYNGDIAGSYIDTDLLVFIYFSE